MRRATGNWLTLALLASCLVPSSIAAQNDARCAVFDTTFESGTVTGLRVYGDRHGMTAFVEGCPQVEIGLEIGRGVWENPENADFRAYYLREAYTSRRSATLDAVADLRAAKHSNGARNGILTIRRILRADLSFERNIMLFDEPSFPRATGD